MSLSAMGRWVRAERKPSGIETLTKKTVLNLAEQADRYCARTAGDSLFQLSKPAGNTKAIAR